MCVENLLKLILASALGMVLMFAGVQSFQLAFILQVMIMVMLIISSLTGFCSISKLLEKAFPSCHENNNKDNK